MRQTVFTCDKCYKTINGKAYKIHFFENVTETWEKSIFTQMENINLTEFDLCEKCTAEIQDLIYGRKEKTMFKIDDGKMMALWKAGWSLEDIADEFRCSIQMVQKHIREMEEKKGE